MLIMAGGNTLRVALVVVAVGFARAASCSAAPAESFDKPLRTTVVDLGRSQYLMPNNPSRIKLTCFYYPDFMVKQFDDPGLKGADISVVPVLDGQVPACRRSRGAGERSITRIRGWSGYFKGVKDQLLFLDASDGSDGGMPFAVFDWKTLEKLFQDSALFWDSNFLRQNLAFERTPDGRLSLRYRRVVEGTCSIPKDGMSCWNSFRKQFGLASAPVPTCTGYRREGDKEWVVGDEGVPPEDIKTTSAIAYPVAAELFTKPSIDVAPGPVKCMPVE
jgi:hypothetical protein